MKKRIKNVFCVAVFLGTSFTSLAFAQELPQQPAQEFAAVRSPLIGAENEANVSNIQASTEPVLVAPVVEEPKKKKSEARKIDLKAVIFDPNADFKAQAVEENRELTKLEEAQYNIHEALHGQVTALSSKGLLADKMKMTFDEGPIEYIAPWVDYNGYFSNIWNNNNDYQNTTYGINFADVGVNIKMKDQKTNLRFMVSPVKSVPGKTYMQAFFADNYITYKVSKNNTILAGHTWLPLGIEGKESPLAWQFFNRSQTSMNYSSVRALGTKIMGNYKYVDYQAGVYSSGRGFFDFFPGGEVVTWVELKPLANTDGRYGKLTIGAGFDGGNAQGRYAVGTGAINYEYKRFRAIAEYGIADGSNGALGYSKNRSAGFNTTLSYRITPRLQILGRYDIFDPNTDKGNNRRTEYTAGINYFVKDQAMKLMLNFVYYNLENGNHGARIMTGTQIVL